MNTYRVITTVHLPDGREVGLDYVEKVEETNEAMAKEHAIALWTPEAKELLCASLSQRYNESFSPNAIKLTFKIEQTDE